MKDGSLITARNIVANAHDGVGKYEIAFKKRLLGQWTFHADLNMPGFVTVNTGPLPNSVTLESRNHYGLLTDFPFQLMAAC